MVGQIFGIDLRDVEREIRCGVIALQDGPQVAVRARNEPRFAVHRRTEVELRKRRVLLSFAFAGIHLEDNAHLLEVIGAACAACRLACASERWKQDRRQNADDGDDYQQFDECKAFFRIHIIDSLWFVKTSDINIFQALRPLREDAYRVRNLSGYRSFPYRLRVPPVPGSTALPSAGTLPN